MPLNRDIIYLNMDQTIFSIHPSMRPVATLYVLALVFFAFVPLGLMFPSSLGLMFPPLFVTAFIGLLGFLVLIIAASLHIQINFTTYTLTPENFKIRTGFVGATEVTIPLVKIQDTTLAYSALQRLFGIGDVRMDTADERMEGGVMLLNIDEPEKYKEQVLNAIDKINQSSGTHE